MADHYTKLENRPPVHEAGLQVPVSPGSPFWVFGQLPGTDRALA